MTEYDYSPEAYERYHAKMEKIHDWAQSVPTHSRLSDPFSATTHAPSHAVSTMSSVGPSQSIRAARNIQLRPLYIPDSRTVPPPRTSPHGSSQHRRAHHLPAPPPPPMPLGIPPSVDYRKYTQHQQVQRARPHPPRSSTAPPVPPVAFPTGPAASRAQARATYPMDRAHQLPQGYGSGFSSGQTYRVPLEPGREIVLPPARPGETFVIVPPHRGRVQVVHDPNTHAVAQGLPGTRGTGSTVRSSSKKPPLFKKLLASISPTGISGPPRSGQPPRRLRRHSTSHF